MVRKLMFYLKGHDRPVSITDTDTSQTLEQLRSLVELSLKGDQISNFETENKELKDILICRSFSIDAIHIVEHPEKKKSVVEENKTENNVDLHDIIKSLSENEELVEEKNEGVLEREEPIVDDNEPIIIIEDQTKNKEEKLNEKISEKGENNV